MIKKYNFLIFAGIFVLSVLLVFCAGYYRKSITSESGKFNLELAFDKRVSKSATAVYDIQNEGIPKKLVQPGRISISTGHGSGVVNGSEQPVWLAVNVTGINGTAKIASTDPIFDGKSECCTKPLMPGDSLDLNVILDLPKEALKNYLVGRGKIEFSDYKSGKKLGEVPVKIINSKPGNSCCTNGEGS
jgi:hypothetical protein